MKRVVLFSLFFLMAGIFLFFRPTDDAQALEMPFVGAAKGDSSPSSPVFVALGETQNTQTDSQKSELSKDEGLASVKASEISGTRERADDGKKILPPSENVVSRLSDNARGEENGSQSKEMLQIPDNLQEVAAGQKQNNPQGGFGGIQNPIDLSGLRDIHLPIRPPSFPWAWGYWAVGLSFLAVVLISGYVYVMWLNSKRKYALRLLSFYYQTQRGELMRFCASASSLLKRVALDRYGQKAAASLFGEDWAVFLEKTGMEELNRNLLARKAFIQAPYFRSSLSPSFGREEEKDGIERKGGDKAFPDTAEKMLLPEEQKKKAGKETVFKTEVDLEKKDKLFKGEEAKPLLTEVSPVLCEKEQEKAVEFLFPLFKKWIIKNTKMF